MRARVSDSLPIPSREDLVKLRESGFTREEVASHYGVSLSRVKRWLRKHGFARAERKIPTEPVDSPIADLPFDTGMTIMERAKLALGTRLTEDRHLGYLLDGRVANTDRILEAARLRPVKRG